MLSLLSDELRLVLSMAVALLIGWNIRMPVLRWRFLRILWTSPINVLPIRGVYLTLEVLLFFWHFYVLFCCLQGSRKGLNFSIFF